MKKILSLVLALILVCGLAATAMAVEANIGVNSEVVEAGDEVTVTIALSEDIAAMMLQVNLTHDVDALTYKSITVGEGYDSLSGSYNTNTNAAQVTYLNFGGSDIAIAAGNIATVVYTANEITSATTLEAAFELSVGYRNADGDTTLTDSVTITVCAGHEEGEWPDSTFNDDGSITNEYRCLNCNTVLRTEILQPGDEGNPIYLFAMDCPTQTIEIAAGSSAFYNLLYFSGTNVQVTGENVSVIVYSTDWYGNVLSSTTYESVDGVVEFYATGRNMLVEIVNEGTKAATYPIAYEIPVGHMEKPQELVIGENVAELPAGSDGYYLEWVADCNGTLTATISGDYWCYYIYNTTSYEQTYSHSFDEDPVVPSDSIAFSKGDVIQIVVQNTYLDDTNYEWVRPAGTLTIDVAVEYAHTWDEGVETTPATCTKEGEMTHTCTICGETKVEPIAIVDHTPAIDAAVAATCTATGLTEGSHCSVCGKVLKAQEVVGKLAHTPAIDAAVAPTCTATGLTEGSHCSVCGEVLVAQEVVAKLAHTPAIDAAVAPTCTATGLTEGSHCSVCGEVLVAQEEVGKLEHTWDEGVTTAPSCIAEGELKHTCTVCGATKSEILDKVAHTDADADEVCDVCEADLSNPKDGDIVSVIAGAAFVGLMGVVALPVMKKKFN